MMYYYNDFFFPRMFGFGFLPTFIFWAVFVYILVMIIKGSKSHGKSPSDILKDRYAKGEITKEQFESMKKDLHG